MRVIVREMGMSLVAVRKYADAESPPTKKLRAKERAQVEVSGCFIERLRPTKGEIFTFHLRGQNRWTTTPSRHYHAI